MSRKWRILASILITIVVNGICFLCLLAANLSTTGSPFDIIRALLIQLLPMIALGAGIGFFSESLKPGLGTILVGCMAGWFIGLLGAIMLTARIDMVDLGLSYSILFVLQAILGIPAGALVTIGIAKLGSLLKSILEPTNNPNSL